MTRPVVVRFTDPAAFATRATDWLLRHEAEHNIVLGLLPELIAGEHGYDDPVYLATLETSGDVVGCAFRTPPFHLGVTRLPEGACEPLTRAVGAVYERLPGLIGPPASVEPLAARWVAAHAGRARVATRMAIHELEQVVFPTRPPADTPRLADPRDRDLLTGWMAAFAEDTGIPVHDGERLTDRLVEAGAVMLWTDSGQPCCMAATQGTTPHGIRVSYVYTPPARRGRGYASALVAHLSQAQLDTGKQRCFLYTDLANPTSNRIYRRLGYRPVAESTEVVFDA